jgi:SHS2 domain-containing protein
VKNNFRMLNHTADLRVKIWGSSEKDLFRNAARGMFSVITDVSKVEARKSTPVGLEADSEEELLVDWLNELIYIWQTKDMLFSEFKIDEMNETHLKAQALGEKFNKEKHQLKREIKAATYHGLKIVPDKRGKSAEIIFDV